MIIIIRKKVNGKLIMKQWRKYVVIWNVCEEEEYIIIMKMKYYDMNLMKMAKVLYIQINNNNNNIMKKSERNEECGWYVMTMKWK